MQDQLAFRPPRRTKSLFLSLTVLGGIILAAGLFWAPPRAWANILLVGNYLIGLALGGLVVVALHYVTGARWSVPLRRLPEALTALLPVAGLALVAVLLFQPSLYPRSAGPHVGGHHVSPLRAFWMEVPFVVVRALAYLGIWLVFASALVRNSRRQDETGEVALTARNVRLSAAFLVVFGLTCWLASDDWLMSLQRGWSSTVFGVYNFAGLFLSALAAVTLLAVWLRQFTPLRGYLTPDRFHDLGTLLFAFSSFWIYIWFCQYLLIWYTNHSDEAIYFRQRLTGSWPAFLIAALVLNWAIPFVVLLFRETKRRPGILAAVALLILVGRWLDLFVMIGPTQGTALTTPGVLEAGAMVGAVGIVGLVVFRALSKAALVPVNDPWLVRDTATTTGEAAAAKASSRERVAIHVRE
jgi:hypothetical protein